MAENQGATENVTDGKADIEQADKLYSLVTTMGAEWNSVNDVKAQLMKEYAKDAIELFGKTNHEKKVELRGLIDKCEDIIPPESFESLKKRAEKVFLRIVYPKNPTLRNILFVTILSLTLLSIVIPALMKRDWQSGARTAELILKRDQLRARSLQIARDINQLELRRAQVADASSDQAKQLDSEINQKKADQAAVDKELIFMENELKTLESR